MTRVTIRPQADRDLDDIYDWIAGDDPAAADRLVRRLVAAAMALRDSPQRGPLRPDIAEGARSVVLGRYLVLYAIVGDTVEIVRFLHGARDMGRVGEAD